MITHFKNAINHKGESFEFFVKDEKFCEPTVADLTYDLCGKSVIPGFVDAHCHIIPMGLDLKKLNLTKCQTKEEVLQTVLDHHKNSDQTDWLHAVHYDQSKFNDVTHITRGELDSISATRPILLRHSNGHASVANSAALIAAKVSRETEDPTGGQYGREENGELNGLLLERAHEKVTSAAPDPTLEEMIDAVLVAAAKMSSLGITCASDMMTGRWNLEKELEAYRVASERGCKVRLRLYAQWSPLLGSRRISAERLAELTGAMNSSRCLLAGAKIFADGAIGSATAATYDNYLTTGQNGQLIYDEPRLQSMVRAAAEAGYQVAVHTIGDRSTDLVMNAFEQTAEPHRHRIEHAMILSDRQIERLAKLNCFVTMQPEFLTAFGHAYKKQLGPERAANLKKCRSLLDQGIKLSFSSDRPIVSGNPWDGIQCAVSRPAGFNPSENIPIEIAIDLYTAKSAEVNGDKGIMGEVKAGAFADFQIYSDVNKHTLDSTYLSGVKTD